MLARSVPNGTWRTSRGERYVSGVRVVGSVAVAGALALTIFAVGDVKASETRRVRYIAGEFGSDLERPIIDAAGAAGVDAAPLGRFAQTVTSDRFTLRLDDAGPIGTVPVAVLIGDRVERHCLDVGVPRTFTGVVPGQDVVIFIDGPSYALSRGCTRGASTGIATLIF
jgi:hypothetical protein